MIRRIQLAALSFLLALVSAYPAGAQLLTLVESETGGSLAGASAALLHPSGDVLLVASETGKALNAYTRNSGTGLLQLADSEVDGIEFPESAAALNTYPIATLTAAPNPDLAGEFTAYVLDDDAQTLLEAAGFQRP